MAHRTGRRHPCRTALGGPRQNGSDHGCDVARRCARRRLVSIKTVSNVINNFEHIRPTTRQKVQLAIDELGYRLNLSARSLRSGRSGVIGLVVPEFSLSYSPSSPMP